MPFVETEASVRYETINGKRVPVITPKTEVTLTNTVNSEMYSLGYLNFANLLTSSKISLIIFMIIGKIELISLFLIFKTLLLKD